MPGTFHPFNINGKNKGQFHSVVMKQGLYPMVVIFVRGSDPQKPLIDLLKKLNDAVDKHDKYFLGSYAVFLDSDILDDEQRVSPDTSLADLLKDDDRCEELTKKLISLDEKEGIKRVILCLYNLPVFKLTGNALDSLRREEMPETILSKLKSLNDKKFATRDEFSRALESILTKAELERWREPVLNQASLPVCKLTDNVLDSLRREEVPEAILSKLKSLNDKKFATREKFSRALESILTRQNWRRWREPVVNHASPAGPKGYDMPEDAEVTVVMYSSFHIVERFAFAKGKMTDNDVDAVMTAVRTTRCRSKSSASRRCPALTSRSHLGKQRIGIPLPAIGQPDAD